MEDDKINAVEKVLGKPVSGDLPDNALIVRRNLLVFGFISVVIVLGGIRLDPGSSVLGFKFIGVSDNLVQKALLATNIYLLAHFAWYSIEGFLEWRLRVTGTKLAFLTGARFGSEHADYPDDPRQSTLYTWWLDNARRIGNFRVTADEISGKIDALKEEVNSIKREENNPNLHGISNLFNETKNVIEKLRGQIETTEKVLLSERISCSLRRFDGWFRLFLKIQNLRWLLIDILMPMAVGGFAICLLAMQLA